MPAENLPDVKISQEMEETILHWLYQEITDADLSRKGVQQKWEDINEWYEKQELEEKINYPFEGAAHLMIGIMPTFCETIKAKIINAIYAPSDPFTIAHFNKDLADFVRPLRRFMTWSVANEVKLKRVSSSAYLEMLKLGTCITKTIFTREVETRFEWQPIEEGSDEGEWLEIPEIKKNQPEVLHPPLVDILFPMHAREFYSAEWKAHRFRESWHDIKAKEGIGEYNDVDKIKAWTEHQKTEFERETADRDYDPEPVTMEEYELYEVWFRHPIKEGGAPVKMQWFIHLESRTALRKRYNWYPLQMDPFDICVYEEREHKIYGRGVGQISLPYQKEVSTMHNQRLDSVTVRNAPVFKKKADSMLPDFLVIRPGGVISVAEMDEIEALFTGQQYDSTITDEEHTLGLLRERLGLEDFSQDLNIAQATSMLAIMAERGRRFDHVVDRIRDHQARIMTKVMLLYQKYYPEGRALQVLGEDGIFVELTVTFPPEALSKGMGIDVTATTAGTSKELDRQNKLALFNLITQYYGQLTQYIIQAQNPQLPEPVRMAFLQIVDALSRFVEDLLDDFNLTHSREIAGVVESARQAAITAAGQPGQPAGNAQQPGMAPVPGAPAGNQQPAGV